MKIEKLTEYQLETYDKNRKIIFKKLFRISMNGTKYFIVLTKKINLQK